MTEHETNCRKDMARNICDWINSDIPDISRRLEREISRGEHIDVNEGLNITGRKEIYEIQDKLLSVLFPGVWSKENIEKGDVSFFITSMLRNIAHKMTHVVRDVLHYHCPVQDCRDCDCGTKASAISRDFVQMLPDIRRVLVSDVETAYHGDPASKSKDEILLSYPCVEAVATYRISHELYKLDIPIIPRIMSERAHSNTGIDIHPGADIGAGFFVDHGTGVVIGETCTIGNNVKLYQGVTIGATSPFDKGGAPRRGEKRHPDVEDNVIIYANAVILGGNTVIGRNSVIGGNSWVTSSVPPNTIVYTTHNTKMKTKTDASF
ncbi:MAG: serine O-acetyltransferase EpsC [Fibrobacterota bacterium]